MATLMLAPAVCPNNSLFFSHSFSLIFSFVISSNFHPVPREKKEKGKKGSCSRNWGFKSPGIFFFFFFFWKNCYKPMRRTVSRTEVEEVVEVVLERLRQSHRRTRQAEWRRKRRRRRQHIQSNTKVRFLFLFFFSFSFSSFASIPFSYPPPPPFLSLFSFFPRCLFLSWPSFLDPVQMSPCRQQEEM